MKILRISVLVFLAFAMLFSATVTPVAAKRITRTSFTGIEGANLCATTADPRCTPGEVHVLPNGKTYTNHLVMVIVFDTSDPRFTGENVVNFTILPATDKGIPSYGTFRFQPYDITDGYWIGFVTAMVSNDFTQVHSFFTAKGYGSLAGQTLIGTNTNGQINGEIFERP